MTVLFNVMIASIFAQANLCGEPPCLPGLGSRSRSGARSHGANQFWRSRSWSRSLFKYFCGAGAGAGATKILLAPAPVMVHRINFIE